jgi:ribose transport system substrate-binding protein
MRRSSVIVRILILLLALGASVSACKKESAPDSGSPARSGGTVKRIVLLNNGNSPFWDACRLGLKDAEKELRLSDAGLTVIMEVNDGTVQGQIEKLRQFANQADIAGVAISALDANNASVAEEMRKLREKGVHVICVDADIDRQRFRDARSYYIGTDNLTAGGELGVAARHLLSARKAASGSYVQFVGRTGSHNAIERMNGFKKAVGGAYREADRMADDTDRTRARENVRNAIRNHPDLIALVGIWSYNAPAIVDVVRQEKKRDRFAIVVFDAEPIAVTQMSQGDIDAMVVQNPYRMGYDSVRLLNAMIRNDQGVIREMFPSQGKQDGDLHDTGLKLVVPDQSPSLSREMFGERTQFMRLSEFKNWLEQHRLTGS